MMSSSIERRDVDLRGGGLKKAKWKSMNNESVNNITVAGDEAVTKIGRWIEVRVKCDDLNLHAFLVLNLLKYCFGC